MKSETPNLAPRLLRAKLSVPALRADAVDRIELGHQIDEGVQDGISLILVSAPAGYGKTTAVSQWIHSRQVEASWFTVDRLDNDPSRFFTYFLAALNLLTGGATETLAKTLATPKLPSPEMVASLLSSGVSASGDARVLAIDDYHLIENPFIHDTLQVLFTLPLPSLVICIATREDPPLFLSRLRTQGRLLELRSRELTFSRDETESLFQGAMNMKLSDEIVDSVILKTEGWIAGLQLFGLSLKNAAPGDAERLVDEFGASSKYVVDYLFEEVMHQLDEETREFLLRTAALDRLHEDLCNHATDRVDSGAMLMKLEDGNFFLVALDSTRSWYRYHHLFSSFLKEQAPEEWLLRTTERAAEWFYSQDLKAEAIKYAIRSNNRSVAEDMIVSEVPDAFAAGSHHLLAKWLESLSGNYVRSNFAIGVYQAWVLFFAGKLDDLMVLMDDLESISLKHEDTVSFVRYQSLKAWLAESRAGHELTIGPHSPGHADEDTPFFQVLSLQATGLTEYRNGATANAVSVMRDAYDLGRETGNPFISLCMLHRLAFYLIEAGNREKAEELCRESLALFADHKEGPLPVTGLACIGLAAALYERDELSEASEQVERGIYLVSQLRLDDVVSEEGIRTAALIRLARGNDEGAESLIAEATRAADAALRLYSVRRLQAIGAELALRRGDMSSAVKWAAQNAVTLEALLGRVPDFEHNAYSQFLLLAGRLDEGEELLKAMASWYESAGRLRSHVSAEILRARLMLERGMEKEARTITDSAIAIAEAQEYRRAVLDYCGDVGRMIRKSHFELTPFAQSLIAGRQARIRDHRKEAAEPVAATKTVDVLSRRETEVLALVNEGLTNQEIGESLFISTGTVKWHVNNILSKLGVSNRNKAAAVFRESGAR